MIDAARQVFKRTYVEGRRGERPVEFSADFGQRRLELGAGRLNLGLLLDDGLQGVETAREFFDRARVEYLRGPLERVVDPRRKAFEALFDGLQEYRRNRALDLGAGFGEQRDEALDFRLRRGMGAQTVRAVGELFDLPFQLGERRALRRLGEHLADVLGLPPDLINHSGINRGARQRIDSGT